MITTIVTTSTVAIINMYAVGGTLALIGIAALAVLAVTKDMTTNTSDKLSRRVSQAVNIALFPLIVLFLVLVVIKVIQFLS
jgi:cytochrome bd-type quinol oxidase subunit 2